MRQRKKRRSPMPEIYIALFLLLFYLPILVVILFSFNDSKMFQWSGFTFSWYEELMQDQTIWQSFFTSLKLAVLSSLAAAILGTLGAVGMAGQAVPYQRAFGKRILGPHYDPGNYSGHGLPYRFYHLSNPLWDGHDGNRPYHVLCPLYFHQCQGPADGLDPSIGEAALDLGASRKRMFFDITLPLILPAVASGMLLAFAMSMDDVVISFFTNGPDTNTLPLQIYSMMKGGNAGNQRFMYPDAGRCFSPCRPFPPVSRPSQNSLTSHYRQEIPASVIKRTGRAFQ